MLCYTHSFYKLSITYPTRYISNLFFAVLFCRGQALFFERKARCLSGKKARHKKIIPTSERTGTDSGNNAAAVWNPFCTAVFLFQRNNTE